MNPMTGNSGNSCILTDIEIDAIGEIMNISMGAAATAVSSMLDEQVLITTPRVNIRTVEKIDYSSLEPAMIVKITYVKGITGSNIMVFRQKDMQYILNTLMGVDEPLRDDFVFDDLSISAACEVMNQMMGASATALSEFLGRRISISIPTAVLMDEENTFEKVVALEAKENVVAIFFDLSITNIMKSEFVCIMDCGLAKMIVSQFMNADTEEAADESGIAPVSLSGAGGRVSEIVPDIQVQDVDDYSGSPAATQQMPGREQYMQQPQADSPQAFPQGAAGVNKDEGSADRQAQMQGTAQAGSPQQPNAYPQQQQYGYGYPAPGMQWTQGMQGVQGVPMYPYPYPPQYMSPYGAYPQQYGYPGQRKGSGEGQENAVLKEHVNVQNVQFPDFSETKPVFSAPLSKGNMNLLMNVPLSVSIEIGRTKKRIREIMDFSQGSIIELEKQAGAPVDIIVNGQLMARGDVVVIDDNFAVRVTEIIGTKELIGSLDGSANKADKDDK